MTTAGRSNSREEKYARLREFERRNLHEEYSSIWWDAIDYEFPWDFGVAGALAFFNSVAPAHMAELLLETGEITENTRRRLEHHGLIALEIARRGLNDPRGRAAVRQLNRIHKNAVRDLNAKSTGRRWAITNDDYLFVLATSLVLPIRWVDERAWRPVSQRERDAAFLHIREQGEHMGIKDIPESYEEFAAFHDAFVEKHFRYSPAAVKLWQALEPMIIAPFTGWLPDRLKPYGAKLVASAVAPSLLTAPMRLAFGVPKPPRLLTLAVDSVIKARSAYVRRQPPRMTRATPDPLPTTEFPDGKFEAEQLGPTHSAQKPATA